MRMSTIAFDNYPKQYMNPVQQTGNGNVEDSKKTAKQDSGECQTCASRKYVDGSSEMDVSFKSPGHISPEASVALVSAHEQMHVSNAVAEGAKPNKELVSSSVTIKMARCPECGVAYAAGGVTNTVMRVTKPNYNADNPYAQRQKLLDTERMAGSNVQDEL